MSAKTDWKNRSSKLRRVLRFESRHAVKHKAAMWITHPASEAHGAWTRGMKMLRAIHKEVAPKLTAMREADERIRSIFYTKKQGYVAALAKYSASAYSIGTIERDNSANENNPFVSCLTNGMGKAQADTMGQDNTTAQTA